MLFAMEKQHFFCKLIPPRPTFVEDMTDEERLLMHEHGRYTRQHFLDGKILIYGPVFASAGPFGVSVFEASSEAEARQLIENDPTVRSGLNKYELSPMILGPARACHQESARQ
jgi:uncharacterized protein